MGRKKGIILSVFLYTEKLNLKSLNQESLLIVYDKSYFLLDRMKILNEI